ncbi:MAG: DUF6879 family protein [Pseudonocardiaceae bacterium]
MAWHQPWLNLVRNITAAGKNIQRVWVVTVPHVDYTRWGLTIAPHNIAAGEDIRWLPRHLIDADALPADDLCRMETHTRHRNSTTAASVAHAGGQNSAHALV